MFYRRIAPELYHNDTNRNDSSNYEQPTAWLPPCFTEDDKKMRMDQSAEADRRHNIRDAHAKTHAHIKAQYRRRNRMAFVDTDKDADTADATRNDLDNQKNKPSRKELFTRFMRNLSLARHAMRL